MADANVLIDLHVGRLLPVGLALPFRLVAPDLVVAELGDPPGAALVAQGLVEETLSPADVSAVVHLRSGQPRGLSVVDLAVLVLSKRLNVPLLTGEKLLRALAQREGVEVRGTLWLLDQMIAVDALGVLDAAAALESMLSAGRRLPVAECEKRLRTWRTGRKT